MNQVQTLSWLHGSPLLIIVSTRKQKQIGTPCARKALSWCRVVVNQVSKSGGEELEVEAESASESDTKKERTFGFGYFGNWGREVRVEERKADKQPKPFPSSPDDFPA